MTAARRVALCALALALVGCGANQGDLEAFVNSVRNQPPGIIPPIPEVKVYEPYAYPGHTRDPFDPGAINTQRTARILSTSSVRLDPNRPKEFLENYPLDALKMVGTLQQQGKLWALVRSPDGTIQRVGPGQHLGENHGRITKISESKIDLVEVVSDGLGGYMERPTSIALSNP